MLLKYRRAYNLNYTGAVSV